MATAKAMAMAIMMVVMLTAVPGDAASQDLCERQMGRTSTTRQETGAIAPFHSALGTGPGEHWNTCARLYRTEAAEECAEGCLLYTSPSPRD
eukprot:15473662-Alexandrium_andersonii.AAC.1